MTTEQLKDTQTILDLISKDYKRLSDDVKYLSELCYNLLKERKDEEKETLESRS